MTPSLEWYGLRALGYDETCIPLTGDVTKDQITIEAICFRIGHTEAEGGRGRFGHFKNYVDLLWNNPNSGSLKRCVWNPWANRMFKKMCEETELGIAGPTSAGKCYNATVPILMFDGSTKPAGDIKPGDVLMGDDSTPRTVQEVHRGHGPMLKVVPHDCDRDPWHCTRNHVLVYRDLSKEGGDLEVEAESLLHKNTEDLRLFRPSNEVLRKILPNPHEFNFHVQSRETFGFHLEEAENMDWVGFSVDGNHRHLLGDFTVAHNSDPAALYGVVSYVTDPTHTLVLVMSTTIKGAKKRIWKTLREYWESIPNLPGQPLWSANEIRGLNYNGRGYGESSGIYLLASEQSNEKAALDKIIGIKAPRTGESGATYEELIRQPEYADLRRHFSDEVLRDLVPRLHNLSQDRIGKLILIIDEMTGMVESILNAVNTNLKPGNVGHFQIIGLGNPNLPYDPFGQFCKPAAGWDGVDLLTDEEWRTESGGLCIRFNGENNPRILEANERYSWMLRAEDIRTMEDKYGRESLFFHRMVLGTWCLSGADEGIYTPADIELSGSRKTEVVWGLEPPVPVSFLDPAFSAGGDRAMACFGLLGRTMEGTVVLLITETCPVKVNINDVKTPVSFQVVHGWRQMCVERKVRPERAAFDVTGGGLPFGDIVYTQWSPTVTGISSGGSASKTPVPGEFHPGTRRPITAYERYANKATEIWYSAHPLFRSGQIFGVGDELAKELCSRQLAKGSKGGGKLKVELKQDYREREGKSPDEADSFLGLVDFCRTRLHFDPIEKMIARAAQSSLGNTAWLEMRKRALRMSRPRNLRKQ